MTWVDIFIVIGLLLVVWGGAARGVIKEFFEFLIVTGNVLVCTHLYGFLSDLFVKYLKTPPAVASTISYLFFYVIISVILWILAGKAEIAANIPPSNGFNRLGGSLMAFAKGIIVCWAILFMISRTALSEDARKFLHGSPTVREVQSITPAVDGAFQTAGSRRAFQSLHPRIQESVF